MGSCQQTPPPGLGPHLVPDVHGPPWPTGGCVAAARGALVPPGLWQGWKWLRVERACVGGVGMVPFVLGVAAGPTRAGSALWGPMRGHWGLEGGHRPQFLRLCPRPYTACFIPWLWLLPTAGWGKNVQLKSMLITYNQ